MESLLEFDWLYYLTSVTVIIIGYILLPAQYSERPVPSIPIYGLDENDKDAPKKRWMKDSINLLQEGYDKFRDHAFQVWTTDGYKVVVPPKFVDELKMLPDSVMKSSLSEVAQSDYTTFSIDEMDRLVSRVIIKDLNKNLAKMYRELSSELEVALDAEFPECREWTPVQIYPRVVRIICRVAGMALVGPSLNRNEEWISLACSFTRDIVVGAARIREWRPAFRWFGKYFTPEIRRIYKHNARATKVIAEIIKQRAREGQTEGYTKPNDAITWIYENLPNDSKNDFAYQGKSQYVYPDERQSTLPPTSDSRAIIDIQLDSRLAIAAASIHTTTQMETNAIYDLATRPSDLEMLREEVTSVLDQYGGCYSIECVRDLKKLDSFVKESQRHGNSMAISFNRRAVKSVTLSDGTQIPAGTLLMAPAVAVSMDPEVYDSPETFDGLRYYKMRERSKEDNDLHQFASIGKTMLHFGAGRHACPGRYLASYEIKVLLANLIMQFDFKLKDGEQRPKNILNTSVNAPDPSVEILLKRRSPQA